VVTQGLWFQALVCLLLQVPQARAENTHLTVQVPQHEWDLVGRGLNLDTGDLYFFVVPKGQRRVAHRVSAGRYSVSILCPTENMPYDSVVVDVKPDLGGTATFAANPLRMWTSYSNLITFGPPDAPYATVFNHGCPLAEALLPVLLRQPSGLATGAEVSEGVAKLSGGGTAFGLPAKTPLELLLTELESVDSDVKDAARRRQVEEILNDQAGMKPSATPILARNRVHIEADNIFLGMLVTALDRAQIGKNETATLTARFLSSHESTSNISPNTSYDLQVSQEPPVSQSEFHVKVALLHESVYQEIAPTVEGGIWRFLIKAEPGLDGCPLPLTYHLRKKAGGVPPKEISSGLLPQSVQVEAASTPSIPSRVWDWLKEFRDWIAWALTAIATVSMLIQTLKKRAVERRAREISEKLSRV
jgi:hypothetical protein